MEFSKAALAVQYLISFILIGVVVIGTVAGIDVNAIALLAGGSILGDGTVTGFYFWKSKNENRAKYAQEFMDRYAKDYGPDAAANIAGIVLRD